jgi:signal transduction histidine kinase/ligand-binding sensor domain-containing protein
VPVYHQFVYPPSPRYLRLIGVLLCLLGPVLLAEGTSGDEWLARWWQTEDGLPDNSVNGVAQTSDGYLWIGTPSGLARFDGLQFETVSLTNVIALPNRGISAMMRGRHNGLWLAMDRGAVVHLAGSASRAFSEELPSFNPDGMTEDAAGNLWIAYHGGSVYRVNNKETTLMTAAQGVPSGIDPCALTADSRGRLWFAKAGQVGVYTNGMFHVLRQLDPQLMRLAPAQDGNVWVCSGFHIYKCDDQGNIQDFGEFHPASSGTAVSVMLEDNDGSVWIGTTFSGLYRCTRAGFEAIHTSNDAILSLAQDREGNIWAGTFGGGLNCIHRRAITLENADNGLPFPAIVSICEAPDKTIWAATQNRVLVRKVNDRWLPIPVSDAWPGDATCVSADANGTVWVGTSQHGLYCWRDGQFVDWDGAAALRGQTLHTILTATNGDLWLGRELPSAIIRVRDGKITTFPVSAQNRIIRAMVEDAAGDIWAGTSKGNLFRISGETISDVTPRPESDLAPIRCLYATPDGTIWIGYAGWGVGYLKGGHYTEVNPSQGLFDDSISHIVADTQGWLWFGANKGIFKVRLRDFEDLAAGKTTRVRSIHYGRSEGLPSLEGTFGDSPDVLRSSDGQLWIPMRTGLIVADPAKLYGKMDPPPALLTRVFVDTNVVAEYEGILPPQENQADHVLNLTTNEAPLHLPPGHSSIEFEFTAFDFSAPENILFHHRLVGVKDEWTESGAARSVTYGQLANGTYTFQVAACNGDGDWNQNPAQITLIVAPFFWQTWSFRLAVLVAFTLTIIAIVRYASFRRLRARLRVLEQQAALQRERARIAKDIHDDLGANLTQIAYLGELANQDRGEPNLVGERISKISATARQAVKALDEIVWAVNPRNDTLAHLLDYAGQFAVDYLRLIGIRCRLDFPTEIPQRELSTDLRHNLFLTVKEALHNIFKHANASEVWLRAAINEEALEVCIEDNGRGFASAPNDALADGLRNMQQRMEEIGGGFSVESQPGKGTKIKLRLPWPEGQ